LAAIIVALANRSNFKRLFSGFTENGGDLRERQENKETVPDDRETVLSDSDAAELEAQRAPA
jgi:hypothetical protein